MKTEISSNADDVTKCLPTKLKEKKNCKQMLLSNKWNKILK